MNLLNYRFNDLLIKRNLNIVYLVIYVNPPFNSSTNICLLSLKKQIINKLGINVKITIKQVAYFKFINNVIKKVIIKDKSRLSKLITTYISYLITQRVSYLKIKNIVKNILIIDNNNIKGYKVKIKGPFPGYNMAQIKQIKSGSLPLSTLRTDIDYDFKKAFTLYGSFGIKV